MGKSVRKSLNGRNLQQMTRVKKKRAALRENQRSGFRPSPTQTGLYSHRGWLEARNFGFRKKRDCTIRVAKTKALISFEVTAKLICVFVFAYAKSRFSTTRLIDICIKIHIPVRTENLSVVVDNNRRSFSAFR